MGSIKRLLLFVAMGTASLVLAGCYGVTSSHQVWRHNPPPNLGSGEPIPELETEIVSAQSPE